MIVCLCKYGCAVLLAWVSLAWQVFCQPLYVDAKKDGKYVYMDNYEKDFHGPVRSVSLTRQAGGGRSLGFLLSSAVFNKAGSIIVYRGIASSRHYRYLLDSNRKISTVDVSGLSFEKIPGIMSSFDIRCVLQYNNLGRIQEILESSPSKGERSSRQVYLYDSADRLIRVIDVVNDTDTAAIVEYRYMNGGMQRSRYQFSRNDSMIYSETFQVDSAGASILEFHYLINKKNGNLDSGLLIKYYANNIVVSGSRDSFDTLKLKYSYDRYGNWIKKRIYKIELSNARKPRAYTLVDMYIRKIIYY